MPDIFLHIPKTGGMTLTTTLKWMYGPASCVRLPSIGSTRPSDLVNTVSRSQLHRADVISGHTLFGLHRHLQEPCRYFTMLRDPVERVLSHYYYHKSRYPESRLAGLSLKQFLECDHPIAHPNRQVHFLSGTNPRERPRESLERAKERIQNDVVWAGLTERFDESLLLFQHLLNWKYPPFYVERKVRRTRPRVHEIPETTVDRIREQNQLDAELYQMAERQFDDAIQTVVPDRNRRLEQFQRWNALVQWVAPPLLWIYRTGRRALRRFQ